MQGCAKSGDVVEVEDVVEDKEVVEIGEDARFCTSCRSEKNIRASRMRVRWMSAPAVPFIRHQSCCEGQQTNLMHLPGVV